MSIKNLYIMVICCTISCLAIMLNHWSKYQSVNFVKDKEEINLKVNNENINNKSIVINNRAQEKKKAEEKKTEDDKTIVNQKSNEYNNAKDANEESLINYNSDETINNNSHIESDKNYAAVFKVSKSDIINKLSLSDKGKILIISTKLSALDYTKTREFLEIGDGKAVVSAMKLLKERLSEKDYNKVREVAGKFLNMEIVENQLY